jgi:uncharacterized protein YbjT (DUF2867 family)
MPDNRNKLILVTGATGHQGGAVLRHLRQRGFSVRALTRDPEKPNARTLAGQGVEVVRGDLDDVASLVSALEGVYGVFSVQGRSEGEQAEVEQGIHLADAANRSRINHFIYSSVGSANRHTGIPHFETKFQIEQHLMGTGLKYTIVRPVFFMENLLGMRSYIENGTFPQPLSPDTRLQIIAVDDIGAFVAQAFEHPGKWQARAVDLASDELSISGIADVLSRITNREVRYTQVPWDQFEAQAGRDYTVMYRWFEQVGYNADISALASEGVQLTRFEPWLRSHWEAARSAAR